MATWFSLAAVSSYLLIAHLVPHPSSSVFDASCQKSKKEKNNRATVVQTWAGGSLSGARPRLSPPAAAGPY
eukprot:745986-Hanusia_phi.AAC.1